MIDHKSIIMKNSIFLILFIFLVIGCSPI